MKKIVAITYYRYDEDYLEDYRRNLTPLCDDFLILKDEDGGLMHDEAAYRRKSYEMALSHGGGWAVVLDPDERLERRAAKQLKKMIAKAEYDQVPVIMNFHYRELYTPTAYRVDGIWGQKERFAVFPLLESNIYSDAKLHMPKQPLNDDYKIINTDLNIYHLKHINPALRIQRRDLYNALDPKHQYQNIGYDYLVDESTLKLRQVMPWRMYTPRYRDYKIDPAIFDI